MSHASFASLHAGLLARKGEARPSVEPPYNAYMRVPAARPAVAEAPPEPVRPEMTRPEPVRAEPVLRTERPSVVRPAETQIAALPSKRPDASDEIVVHPEPAACGPEHPEAVTLPPRSTVRLTREQSRALRLASLILDRSQQDILAAGLKGQFEALACTDLAKCACFRALAQQAVR